MTSPLKTTLLRGAAVTALLIAAACGGSGSSDANASSAEAQAPRNVNEQSTKPKPVMAPQQASFAKGEAKPNSFWWPDQVDLTPLRQNAAPQNPLDPDFDYAEAFSKLDIDAVKADLEALMTDSQEWWPADYGHYGPFFIRMAWHSAGTYRVSDGRGGAGGGQQRFEPLNSWPDNANLDKARRLLWPIKQKYGNAISWADLMVLTGNVALESMGFPTYGFAGGREDDWQAELVYWGPETEMLASDRFHGGELQDGLAAVQMGLIYVNPEGPGGNPDPMAAAERIRTTFGRMAMNDEETVALIAGGHTFGKAHGAAKPAGCVGPDPSANGVAGQGVGWDNTCGEGKGADTITSGLEGAWTSNPIAWTQQYIANLYNYEWEQTRSPAGAIQWVPVDNGGAGTVPDAHRPDVTHQPIMFTTDLALKTDPAYREITQRWYNDPSGFEDAFARAWFKLTHRDMGPRARYISNDLPDEALIWQDPVPTADYAPINGRDVAALKADILASGLPVADLVRTAWASAASYRETDMRGGTDGGRLRLAPQNSWAVNEGTGEVIAALEAIQQRFNAANSGKAVSIADLIVLAGTAGIEKAAADAGHSLRVPFEVGRTDATQEMTDTNSFAVLEPKSDGFRNFLGEGDGRPADALIERADMLDLTVSEMTALIGGLRSLGVTMQGTEHGVFTETPGQLSNDFFVNLLDMRTAWAPTAENPYLFVGRDRVNGEARWTATEVDLVFGSNAELRAVAEYYAYSDAEEVFLEDFAEAWTKVMNLGRF